MMRRLPTTAGFNHPCPFGTGAWLKAPSLGFQAPKGRHGLKEDFKSPTFWGAKKHLCETVRSVSDKLTCKLPFGAMYMLEVCLSPTTRAHIIPGWKPDESHDPGEAAKCERRPRQDWRWVVGQVVTCVPSKTYANNPTQRAPGRIVLGWRNADEHMQVPDADRGRSVLVAQLILLQYQLWCYARPTKTWT